MFHDNINFIVCICTPGIPYNTHDLAMRQHSPGQAIAESKALSITSGDGINVKLTRLNLPCYSLPTVESLLQ